MSKFKAGDRVRDVTFSGPIFATVVEVGLLGRVRVKWDDEDGEGVRFFPASDFELIEPVTPSPVRVKTVKEIVPGVYGRVAVDEPTQVNKVKEIPVNLVYKNGNNTQHWRYLTATELRDSARIFEQLAEAMEDE